MGVIITFYTFLFIDRFIVGRDIFTCSIFVKFKFLEYSYKLDC